MYPWFEDGTEIVVKGLSNLPKQLQPYGMKILDLLQELAETDAAVTLRVE